MNPLPGVRLPPNNVLLGVRSSPAAGVVTAVVKDLGGSNSAGRDRFVALDAGAAVEGWEWEEEGVNGKVGEVWETGEKRDGPPGARSPDTRRVPAIGLEPEEEVDEGVREGEEKMDAVRWIAAVTGEEW